MPSPQARQTGVPRHVAVIMDGNGRWAARRSLPRQLGHRAGVKAVRTVVEGCVRRGVEALTVFAFSSENWRRPTEEVTHLMELFVEAMDQEVDDLNRNGIRLQFIGEFEALKPEVLARLKHGQQQTARNERMLLTVALSYGGRWDIVQAARRLAARVSAGEIALEGIDEEAFGQSLQLAAAPEPDLFIRTGGEHRISNFLLWQLAYTELYFCDTLWPDFDDDELEHAFHQFARRERRFGQTSAQVRGG